jgi:hypothetical protein
MAASTRRATQPEPEAGLRIFDASMGDRLATIEAKRGPGRPAKAKVA